MKLALRRLLIFLVVLTMVIPAGLAYAATDDGNAPQGDEAVSETPLEEGEELSDLEEIDPGTLNVHKLGDDLDLEAIKETGSKAKLSGTITQEMIAEMSEDELNQSVRVSIFMEDPAVLDKYTIKQTKQFWAKQYRSRLESGQITVEKRINKAIGRDMEVRWHLTLAVNAISTEATYAEISKILEVKGVKSVEKERRYNALEDTQSAEPNTSLTSTGMTGASAAWASGYTGAGTRIAIIDTGLDVSHQSFDSEAFDYAIDELEADGATIDLMTEDETFEGLNGKGIYYSSKLPYVYNYVDQDLDVEHVNDTEGEHGSHVAGIAAANRYINVNGEFKDAAENVYAVGMAPDAQLIVMKVFGKKGGAYDSDYMAAIEDAIVLECDSCNLSLGSSDPGYTYDTTYQEVLNRLSQDNDGMIVSISAGNSGSFAGNLSYLGEMFIDDVNMDTVGNPGSYINSLCVASAENIGITGSPLVFNEDQKVYYTEGKHDITTLANEDGYDYVYIYGDYTQGQGVGTADEYAAVNEAVPLAGKVVIVSRGGNYFSEKGNNAIPYNPAAVVVANNQAGTISMALDDYTGDAPMVSITQNDGIDIANGADDMQVVPVTTTVVDEETGEAEEVTYSLYALTGKVSVSKEVSAEVNGTLEEAEISDFSSWGIPGSLLMKPEITAPGGNIYSVNGTHTTQTGGTGGGSDKYELMSGTSMAAPHIAGLSAVLLQYIKEADFTKLNEELTDNYTNRAIAQSLLMSTAVPMQPYGYLSLLQQGAGLADVSKAINAGSVVMMDNAGLTTDTGAAQDGKVKVELGDDPDKTGEYQYSFTIYNTTDVNEEFELTTDMFTQDIDDTYADYGIELMSPYTRDIAYSASYSWNAELDVEKHDVDLDGDTDADDAQAVLDFITGENNGDELDLEAAEMDGDGKLTSRDAQILLTWTPEGYDSNYIVPANGKAEVIVTINIKEGFDEYPGGAYIEGFTYADCITETAEGEDLSHTHSIPVLGFYGSWTDASMFDKMSYYDALELMAYGEDPADYVDLYTYAGNYDTNFMSIKYDGNETVFTGNPYTVEEEGFPYDRLAISSRTEVKDFYYNLIRPAGTTGYAVSYLDEDHYIQEVVDASIGEYLNPGVWYYTNEDTVQNYATATQSVNKTISNYGFEEGDLLRVGFYAVPEYYAMLLNGSLEDYGYDMQSWYSGILYNDGFLNLLVQADIMGEGAEISYDLVVDDTEPVIDKEATVFDAEAKTITVKASDNENIAYVAIMSVDGEVIYQEYAPADPVAEETFDVSEAIEDAQGYVAVFVGDYAGNEAAVAIRVNDAEADDPTLVSDVKINPEEINLFQGQSQDLNVKVLPITAENKSVVWSSEDETVATVNEEGTVTGVAEGTTTVKAISAENAEIYGECSVKVIYVDQDLNGLVWDEDGAIWYSNFNTGKLPEYNKDSACDVKNMMTAYNYYGDIISGTMDTSTATSSLYYVDTEPEEGDSYALTKLGDNFLWATDLALGFEDYGTPLAYTYGGYVVLGNLMPTSSMPNTGYYYGLGDFRAKTGNAYFGGIAYKGTTVEPLSDELKALYQEWYGDEYEEYYPDDSYNAPSYYLLDENGKIWKTKATLVFATDEEYGDYDDVEFSELELVIDTGISTNFLYQSLYYDGEYLYWSHYDDGDYVELYVIELETDSETGEETGTLYDAGHFDASVWPVGGLYEMDAYADEDGQSGNSEDLVAAKAAKFEGRTNTAIADREEIDSKVAEALGKINVKNAAEPEEAAEEAVPAVETESAEVIAEPAEEEADTAVYEAETEDVMEADSAEEEQTEEEPSGSLNSVYAGTVTKKAEQPAVILEGEVPLEEEQYEEDPEEEEPVDTESVEILITEETASANGLVTVKYDPEKIGFIDAASELTCNSIHIDEEEGLITFAYADVDKIEAETVLAAIEFEPACEDTVIKTVTMELNDDLALDIYRETSCAGAGHDWDEGEVTTPATKTKDGVITHYCSRCSATLEETFRNPGWNKDETGWYYLNEDGTKAIGWKKVSGKWYYMDEDGVMQIGWQKVSGKWYYMDASGAMQTGWQKIDGKWYHFNASGAMQTGWQKIDSKWYYFNASGVMQTGWQKIDGKDYYFKSSGVMAANEWVTGYWWLGSSGAWTYKYKASWEKTSDGHWMFKAANGWTAKNTTIIINDVSYTFDANGWMK